MNNIEKNQDSNLNKNAQGQGGRTEETREGRDSMRGAGSENNRNFSKREESEVDEEDEFEDTEEASLDSADEEEDEEGAELEGTEKSDLGFNRGRDTNRDQSNRI